MQDFVAGVEVWVPGEGVGLRKGRQIVVVAVGTGRVLLVVEQEDILTELLLLC